MTTTVGAVDARLGPGRLAMMGHQHVRVICAGATAVPLHTIGAVITATAASAKHVEARERRRWSENSLWRTRSAWSS